MFPTWLVLHMRMLPVWTSLCLCLCLCHKCEPGFKWQSWFLRSTSYLFHAENENKDVILVSLWTQTNFGGMFQIIDDIFKSQQNANWTTLSQTDLYSKQRNWKQKVLRRNKRTWKGQSEISPEYWRQKWKGCLMAECNKNKNCVRKRPTEF